MVASQFGALNIAQATGWWEMGRRFREGGTALQPQNLLIALGVVTALIVTLWAFSRFFQRDDERPYHGPRRLFWQLCRAHELNLFELWLLWRLARAHRLKQPAMLFVEEQLFDVTSLSRTWQDRTQRLGRLRERLFA